MIAVGFLRRCFFDSEDYLTIAMRRALLAQSREVVGSTCASKGSPELLTAALSSNSTVTIPKTPEMYCTRSIAPLKSVARFGRDGGCWRGDGEEGWLK